MTELRKLDSLIAAAIQSGIHLNLLLISLPGRTAWSRSDFSSGGDFDLFINSEKMEKATLVWQTLAQRYKDVPSAYLSFTPFFEAMNKNLSTGAPFEDYDEADVCKGLDALIAATRTVDPDRFIIYEATANNLATDIIRESNPSYTAITENYNNVRISYNFCEMPYVYAEMTAVEGENIDFNNHSMFKPEYPVIIYAAQNYLIPASPITIDGCLPAGTQLDLYLARTEGDGTFTISSEDGILWEEALSVHNYTTSYQLSGYYPYATSDKKISITLQKDTDQLSLACSGGRLEWSGMDVTLPDSYAVERWYSYSGYDAWLDGDESLAGMSLRTTSRVMLCPNSNTGHHITIHEDITYSSELIAALSTKETIEAWGQAIRAFTPEALIRFENAYFNAGTTEASAERYYEDMLSMFDKYDFDWYSNDYGFVLNNLYAGSKLVRYRDDYVNLELLQLLQKHR